LLDVPAEVATMVESGHFEAYWALDVVFGDGHIIHICQTAIESVETEEFGAIAYRADLRELSGALDESVDLTADRCELSAQTVDGFLGGLAVGNEDALNGALGIFGAIFIDDDGNPFHAECFRGDVENVDDQDPLIKFQVISHMCSGGPVGGDRPLSQHCTNIYKKAGGGCNSTSDLPDCDHTAFGPNGCDKHDACQATLDLDPTAPNNLARFAGKIFRIQPLDGAAIKDPQGRIDGGNDFSSLGEAYKGRVQIPVVR